MVWLEDIRLLLVLIEKVTNILSYMTVSITEDLLKLMLIPTVEQELKDAEQAAIDKKASGKQKLKDLGLDDAEIKALIG